MKKNQGTKVFIFAYCSFRDPIFQSAVLPYFEKLSRDDKLSFILLTFEQDKYKLSKEEKRHVKERLSVDRISWFYVSWYMKRFKFITRIFALFASIFLSLFLLKKHRVKAVYSEGSPGIIFGHFIAKIFNIPHIIHTFEPHEDYMIEAGIWRKNSWKTHILRYFRYKVVARGAAHIMIGTQKMIDKLKEMNIKAKLHRVPSCVDLSLFKYSNEDRERIRKKYQINKDDCVIVYLGKFGEGTYMDEEIFHFFNLCKNIGKLNYKFFLLAQENHENIRFFLKKYNIKKNEFFIESLIKEEVPQYLSASDFGFSAYKQKPSRRYGSPIKNGEYWACGLPIIIPDGISDDYLLTEKYKIGIRLHNTSEESFIKVIKEIERWLNEQDKEEVRERIKTFVSRDRSVENYRNLYREIFNSL